MRLWHRSARFRWFIGTFSFRNHTGIRSRLSPPGTIWIPTLWRRSYDRSRSSTHRLFHMRMHGDSCNCCLLWVKPWRARKALLTSKLSSYSILKRTFASERGIYATCWIDLAVCRNTLWRPITRAMSAWRIGKQPAHITEWTSSWSQSRSPKRANMLKQSCATSRRIGRSMQSQERAHRAGKQQLDELHERCTKSTPFDTASGSFPIDERGSRSNTDVNKS